MASPNSSSLTGLEPLGRALYYLIKANASARGAYTWVHIYLTVHPEYHEHFPDFYGLHVMSDGIAISVLMTQQTTGLVSGLRRAQCFAAGNLACRTKPHMRREGCEPVVSQADYTSATPSCRYAFLPLSLRGRLSQA